MENFSVTPVGKETGNAILDRLISNMVRVEGGTFTMGATAEQGNDAYKDESPVHKVTLSSFSIGKYEVTQEEWETVMGNNPSHFKGSKRPVENVSRDDCQEFIKRLNDMTGMTFRLPTEAEWEYAARGGNMSVGYKYSGSNDLDEVAWCKSNSDEQTHEVGTKKPNELGLYDMSGNVGEWCQDWYVEYDSSAVTNPVESGWSPYQVARGGSCCHISKCCRVSTRIFVHSGLGNGFRLVLPLQEATQEKDEAITPDAIIDRLISNMVHVKGGKFTMGKTVGQDYIMCDGILCHYDNEMPAHQVTLSSFSIGKYEVTQEEWQAVMGNNPSHFKGSKRPVESVSWDDCQEFIKKLNARIKNLDSMTGMAFRLPTEAEWEYAARGGKARGYRYSGSDDLDEVAWHSTSSCSTHEVGKKKPNEFGLYDMNGNVNEWCQDWYGTYNSSAETNPTGPSLGSWRVYRGGCWDYGQEIRVSRRGRTGQSFADDTIGFRLVLSQQKEPVTKRKVDTAAILEHLKNNMVHVEGGTFTMGATAEQSDDADDNEKPAHQVTLSSFSIAKYEVTQEEWETVMGNNPSGSKGAKRPVENVSWNDCQEFIKKLNAMTGLTFRLLTEAEWEYAARGGNKSCGYQYSGSNNIDEVAWYIDEDTQDVGTKKPNELGLYDMNGNVWEWCQDWYGEYDSSAVINPTGPSSGDSRVCRGGSYCDDTCDCRVSNRSYGDPDDRNYDVGFRLAL